MMSAAFVYRFRFASSCLLEFGHYRPDREKLTVPTERENVSAGRRELSARIFRTKLFVDMAKRKSNDIRQYFAKSITAGSGSGGQPKKKQPSVFYRAFLLKNHAISFRRDHSVGDTQQRPKESQNVVACEVELSSDNDKSTSANRSCVGLDEQHEAQTDFSGCCVPVEQIDRHETEPDHTNTDFDEHEKSRCADDCYSKVKYFVYFDGQGDGSIFALKCNSLDMANSYITVQID